MSRIKIKPQQESKMTIDEKGQLIGCIIRNLRNAAEVQKKPFDEGDIFFSLAFKQDSELKNIARLCRV